MYLPANSELDVYIWRLTDTHEVWYEWIAESFLPSTIPAKAANLVRSNSLGVSLNDKPMESPMMDAPLGWGHAKTDSNASALPERELRIKIGQTALHNPAGRSSWIGL